MQPEAEFLLNLSVVFLLGIVTEVIGRHTRLPRVTLLLVFGILIGPEFLDLIPVLFTGSFELVSDIALVLVGFLLGGRLTAEMVKHHVRHMLWISLFASVGVASIIVVGLFVVGVSAPLSILLGCIASATAPASTVDVIAEMDARGPFASLLEGIVALDDAWALILFSLGLAVAGALAGTNGANTLFFNVVWELGGALLLGISLGFPAAYLSGRLKPGQPMLTEALGLVFLCGGIALWLEVSFLIASMVMGAVVTHRARHHEYPFHAIKDVEGPVLVLFFVLAGATFELASLREIGAVGGLYLLLRSGGKIAGGWIGGWVCRVDSLTRRWIGVALLPQAGVAIGMALVAVNHFPEYRQELLSIIIGSTMFFELIGPILTRLALTKMSGKSLAIKSK